jgi:hypothetical protein
MDTAWPLNSALTRNPLCFPNRVHHFVEAGGMQVRVAGILDLEIGLSTLGS